MKQIELIDKRKPREKHFLQEDGTIIATIYDNDIHYLKDGKYEEIDNLLEKNDNFYVNKSNSFKTYFNKKISNELMRVEANGHFLIIMFDEKNSKKIKNNRQFIIENKKVKYKEIFDNIDLEYSVLSNKVKESIIIKSRDNIPSDLIFNISTDMELISNTDGSISAKYEGKTIFIIDTPYMYDSNNIENNNISYDVCKDIKGYKLKLVLDSDWLNSSNITYPVIIDPTITGEQQEFNVRDTYIYPFDTDVNKGMTDILKVGVERANNNDTINRALLAFDLPDIGTGSQIVEATLSLVGYPAPASADNSTDLIEIHRMISSWNESDANWANQSNQYDSKVEGCFYSKRSVINYDNTIDARICTADITNLVRRWYTDIDNYGIMLKQSNESYTNEYIPAFFSRNNNVSGNNPKPLLIVKYRNQNGLEEYMKYFPQTFSTGSTFVNAYNGNMIGEFIIGSTNSGKLPALLKLIYNTNDVVLNNDVGYGVGMRLNLHQTIRNVTIDGIQYLEYVDEDGTIHYFLSNRIIHNDSGQIETETESNTYYDEDGLDIKIIEHNSNYILFDKNGNSMEFTKVNAQSLLTKIIDTAGNYITIEYNNSIISRIIDSEGEEINISKSSDLMQITSSSETMILNYLDGKITSISGLYGNMLFEYNANNLITKITDINGKKIKYDYYSQIPYRIKKVTEFGTNNNEGSSFELFYSNASTTMIDNHDKASTMTFNQYGIVVSTTNLKSGNSLYNACGKVDNYGETFQEKNKLISSGLPIGHVKNFISNSSFEENNIIFTSSSSINMSISNERANSGNNSLKITNTTGGAYIYKEYSLEKGHHYTLSSYISNNNSLRMELSYYDENNVEIKQTSDIYNYNDEFVREDITIEYPQTASSNLMIKYIFENTGFCYLDDIQLEEGEVVNNYNYIDNSDFSDGFNHWILNADDSTQINDKFEIIELADNIKAIKINMTPDCGTSISRSFNLHGVEGDNYTISFWYKNEGIIGDSEYTYNNAIINFGYELGQGSIPSIKLNSGCDEWQYFSYTFTAEHNYNSLFLSIFQSFNANTLYITNVCLFKNVKYSNKRYDKNGNVLAIKSLNDNTTKYNYNSNNQLSKITNPNGDKITFEYDKIVSDRIISIGSDSGMNNKLIYDENGNILTATNLNNIATLSNGTYLIRLYGCNKYLKLIQRNILFEEEKYRHDCWNIEFLAVNSQTTDDVSCSNIKISHSIVSDTYLSFNNGRFTLSNSQNASIFTLIKNQDDSFNIKLGTYFLYYLNNTFTIGEYDKEYENNYKFIFETHNNKKFIERDYSYSSNGKYLVKSVDSRMNEINYNVNQNTGKTNYYEDSKKQRTNYIYDSKNRISKITSNNKYIEYNYNNNNMLSKIYDSFKEYNLFYDEFLNLNQFSINNTPIVEAQYNNLGNITSLEYGNTDRINYEYDNFDRLSKIIKSNDTFSYKYNKYGNIAKIVSNNKIFKSDYDASQRLRRYGYDNFKADYYYDNNNNITRRNYKLDNINKSIANAYDLENNIISSTVNDNEININYSYDYLNRITSKNVNNLYNVTYDYITNGNRTTQILKNININNLYKYTYKYDSLNNITHIYLNDKLSNKYYYDEYNQLIREDNYTTNKTTRYKYDISGNILSRKVCELNCYNVIDNSKFEYNDVSWNDKLTQFNGKIICYDAIGNPVNIGNNIHMTWKNGKELSQYVDQNNSINYEYNKDGIRLSKTINGIKTEYAIIDSKILFEKTDNNVIYYIRDEVDDLIGLEYNNNLYYYLKNAQNDIIGIIDSNGSIVAKYLYDGYGNILSIQDGNGNNVSSYNNNIANINPFRYRSYYYDSETNLYYLNNRYYSPSICRFINADSIINSDESINGNNLFIYCINNPINYTDYNGNNIFSKTVSKIKNACNYVSKKIGELVSKITNSTKSNTKIKSSDLSSSSNKVLKSSNVNKLPMTGEPDTTAEAPNGNQRHYGPDGRADTDTDYSHPEHHPELPNPHAHDWTWDKNGFPHRGKAYDPNTVEKIVAVGATVTAAYVVYRVIRMIPSLVPGMWWSIPLNATAP